MRTIFLMTACIALGGCVADTPAALESPDIHDTALVGNYTTAIGAQLGTASHLASEATTVQPVRPVMTRPVPGVTCVSPGYSVPTTGC